MRISIKIKSLLLAIGALSFTSAASADTGCIFTVVNVALDPYGDVIGIFSNAGTTYTWYLCNESGTVSVNNGYTSVSVTSGACSAYFAQLLTARTSGQTVAMFFHGPTSCASSQLPATTGWPNPYPASTIF